MTSPTRSVGRAYVEMHGDYSKLGPEAEREIQDKLDNAAKHVDFDELGRAAEKAGEDAGKKFGDGFYRDARGRLRNARGQFVKDGERVGKDIVGGLARILERGNGRSGLLGAFSRLGSQALEAFQSGFSNVKSFGDSIGSVFSKIGDVGGEIGSVLKIGSIIVLIPIVIQLAGALVQLGAALFALPAAAGVALTAILPLVIAFQGFGDAVSAGLSGDTDKFNEALKKLAPSARTVVKELVALGPQFRAIKNDVQGAFFKPLQGFFTEFGRTLLPLAHRGLTLVAGSLGNLARGLGNVFTQPQNLATFNALFATTNRIVQTLEPAFANLAQALLDLIRPALPFLERGATAFRNFAATVEAFTKRIAGDGSLSGWLDKAFKIGGDLLRLVKELGAYLITLLGGEVGDQGASFLNDLADAVARLNTFLKSKEGQTALHNLTTILKAFGAVVLLLINMEPTAFKAFNAVFQGVRLLLKGLEALGGGFVFVIAKIVEFVKWLGLAIGHGFAVAYRAVVGWVSSAGSAIGDFFTKDIPRWFNVAVDWFKALPGRILDGIESFRDAGRNFIIDTLTSWYQAVFRGIGELIGLFLSLPYLVQQGWQKSITFLGDFFTAAWNYAVSTFWLGVHEVEAVVNAIPGLLVSAGHAIEGFFVNLGNSIWSFLTETLPNTLSAAMDAVGNFFVSLWNNVFVATWNAVVSGFNRVTDFISSLPDRVRALGPKLYNAAVDLGRQIGRGLSEIGNFASDIGKKIVSTVKSGVNWIIDSINRGIADIDDRLPVSLPRIPRLAKGALVDSPTLALVGEAGPEVVLPLSDPKRAQQLAEDSGLTKILREGKTSTTTNVAVYLDPSGVMIPIARTVVDDKLEQQGAELAYGVRGN